MCYIGVHVRGGRVKSVCECYERGVICHVERGCDVIH